MFDPTDFYCMDKNGSKDLVFMNLLKSHYDPLLVRSKMGCGQQIMLPDMLISIGNICDMMFND